VKPFAVASFALCLLAGGPSRAQDKAEPKARINGAISLPGAVQIASGISPDKQAVTVLFSGHVVSVGSGRGPLLDTRTTTVSVPLDVKGGAAKLSQDIRGYVSIDGNARAVLVVQAAGMTTVVDLKKSEVKTPVAPDPVVAQAQAAAKEAAKAFPAAAKGPKSFDFFHRINGTVGAKAGAGYQVTFILLVERDSDTENAGAMIQIDSLDIELKPGK